VILKIGLLGEPVALTVYQGWQVFFASLPIAFAGLGSAIHQGKVCASGVEMGAKRPEATMKPVIYGAMVETYAVLGLLVTLFLLIGLQFGG
jgi:V/A-type H+-transporting ATPase subunit K